MSEDQSDVEFGARPRRIAVPGVLDVLLVSEPTQIAYLDRHASLERELDRSASWLHGVVAGRLQKALAFGGKPLPVFLSRDDRERGQRQRALEARLERLRGLPGPERDAIADYVAGEPEAVPIGVLVQRWCGRLFDSTYTNSKETYRAGRRLASFPSAPPWRTLYGLWSGQLERDKQLLEHAARSDLHCVHATSIGAENIVRTVKSLRKAAARADHQRLSPDEILRACLFAPKAVLRGVRAELSAPFLDRPLTRQTLVIFLVARAYAKSGDLDVAFLADGWSACPARSAVAELLRSVWHAAHHDEDEREDVQKRGFARRIARALS